VLLDALFALAPYGAAIIVAGAQAIYLHTGDADFAIAPSTIDSDFVINPSLLVTIRYSKLRCAMRGLNFHPARGSRRARYLGDTSTGRDHQELIPVTSSFRRVLRRRRSAWRAPWSARQRAARRIPDSKRR